MPQTDEGEVQVTAELPVGTRIERAEDIASGSSRCSARVRQGAGRHHHPGGRRRRVRRRQRQPDAGHHSPRAESRARRARAIRSRTDLRQLVGVIPGVIITTRASGGNQPMTRLLGGGGGGGGAAAATAVWRSRFAATTSARRQRLAVAAKALMDKVPEVRNAQIGREEGRPELAIRVDRPKAALLGLSVTSVASTHPHEHRRHAGGVLPRARQGVPDHRPAARGGSRPRRRRQRRADLHAAGTGAAGEEPARRCATRRGRPRSSARTSSASLRVNAEPQVRAQRRRQGRQGPAAGSARVAGLPGRLRRRGRSSRPRRSSSCSGC